jgi:hypothetical protein
MRHGSINTQKYKREALLLVKMKEKKLLKIQPLPKVLRVQKNFITGQNEREETT